MKIIQTKNIDANEAKLLQISNALEIIEDIKHIESALDEMDSVIDEESFHQVIRSLMRSCNVIEVVDENIEYDKDELNAYVSYKSHYFADIKLWILYEYEFNLSTCTNCNYNVMYEETALSYQDAAIILQELYQDTNKAA